MRYPSLRRLLSCLALALSAADARDLAGADAILQRLAASSDAGVVAGNPLADLKTRVAAFARDADKLPPETAAAQWLALYDAFVSLPAESFYRQSYHDRLDLARLIQSLPAPEAWDPLAAAILTRTENATSPRELGLRMLGAIISGEHAKQTAAADKLRATIKANKKLEDYQRESLLQNIEEIAAAVAESAGDESRLAAFAKELEKREDRFAERNRPGASSLPVPDLVRYAGRPEAEPLLLRALLLDTELNVSGESTRRVLGELALGQIEQLKRPHWGLVASIADVALYEAFDKKFPARGLDRQRQSAAIIYLFGLVAAERIDDATRLVFAQEPSFGRNSLGYAGNEVFTHLQRAGRGDAVFDFLAQVLDRDPSLPFWDDFISIAAGQSRAKEALAVLRATLAKPDLPADAAAGLRVRYATALLAADEVDEGVAVLRALVAEDKRAVSAATTPPASAAPNASVAAPAVPDAAEDRAEDERDSGRERIERINRLIKLGELLEKPELVDEAIAAAKALAPTLSGRDIYVRSELIGDIAEALIARDQAAEAEAFLADELVRLQAAGENEGLVQIETSANLIKLASLYHRAGRHADVLRIFAGSPDLHATDLSQLPMVGRSGADVGPHFAIADALIDAGRAAEARRILQRLIQDEPGRDDAYVRLEKIDGPDYEAFLDRAARWDRFEERPLIWKARQQFAAGNLEEAEKTIRAAIAIDPSDGEQGKGDRLRAYATLGDILEKRDDAAQAATLRGAVAAIRISEEADDWWEAGLLTRAVRLYEKGLLKFSDAYCIQSRLALRYNELGDFAKAEQHYRRAFELMPESFGRVESHCFGCEGAFNGERAQNAADKVFTRLAAKMPDRAQVFYLLGYLRSSQDRQDEAAANYRKAVALDPDYLNAWAKLQGLSDLVALPAAERQAIALAILRLDPSGKHARPSLDNLADLRPLWAVIRATEAALPERETGPLYSFTAARARQDAAIKAGEQSEESYNWNDRPLNLREHLSENELFAKTAQFIEMSLMR